MNMFALLLPIELSEQVASMSTETQNTARGRCEAVTCRWETVTAISVYRARVVLPLTVPRWLSGLFERITRARTSWGGCLSCQTRLACTTFVSGFPSPKSALPTEGAPVLASERCRCLRFSREQVRCTVFFCSFEKTRRQWN